MTQIYSSNVDTTGFDDTTIGTLPAEYTQIAGTWQVSALTPVNGHNHALECTSDVNNDLCIINNGIATNLDMDVFSSAEYIAGGGTHMTVICRANNTGSDYYLAAWTADDFGQEIDLFVSVGNSLTSLGNATWVPPAEGAPMGVRIQCIGTTVRCRAFALGSEPTAWMLEFTDSEVSAAGYGGVFNGGGGGPQASLCDVIVNTIGSGDWITVDSLITTQMIGAAISVTGQYGGYTPTGIDVSFDQGVSWSALTGFSAATGQYTGSTTLPVANGLFSILVRDTSTNTITSASAAFTISGAVTTIPPNDPAFLYSPYTFHVTSGSATTINSGAYCEVPFPGNTCILNFDTSLTQGVPPEIEYQIDGVGRFIEASVAPTVNCHIPTSTSWAPNHFLRWRVKSTSSYVAPGGQNGQLWDPSANPNGAIIFTGLSIDFGGSLTPAQPSGKKNVLIMGDSMTQGYKVINETASADVDWTSTPLSWAFLLKDELGVEVGTIGFGGQGWIATGVGSIPPFTSTYNNLYAGQARSFSSPTPNLILIEMGNNDGSDDTTSQRLTVLNALLSAVPGVPIAMTKAWGNGDPSQDGYAAAAIAACDDPTMITLVNNSTWFETTDSADGVHPDAMQNFSSIAPRFAAVLRPLLFPTGGGGGSTVITTGFGFSLFGNT